MFFLKAMVDTSLAVYIHWPFCKSICPYCHFNRYLLRDICWREWQEAFLHEIKTFKEITGERTLVSIFFGGGTPSLMRSEWVEWLIQTVQDHWKPTGPIEITLEMNPNDVEKVEEFMAAGINRVSMGIQSFQEKTLTYLGRKHTVAHVFHALTLLKQSGVRYSFDLIYGHEHHDTLEAWQRELETALPWIGGHLSLYELSYEEGTPFYKKRHLQWQDDHLLALGHHVERFLTEECGLHGYEISNYARPGEKSVHNLVYWKYKDYVGLGPGAHGRVTDAFGKKHAFENHKMPKDWLYQLRSGKSGNTAAVLTGEAVLWETLLMGLRLSSGLSLERIPLSLGGIQLFSQKIQECINYGLLEKDPFQEKGLLILTHRGKWVLNSVVSHLQEGQFKDVG